MKLLSDLPVEGKRVFVRADLDVPLDEVNLESNPRLVNLRPTVDYLYSQGASKIIIGGHIGRPEPSTSTISTEATQESSLEDYSLEATIAKALNEKPPYYNAQLSTEKIKTTLEIILGMSVIFAANFAKKVIEDLELFENLRFWPGETENDLEFAKLLAKRADAYVCEAFGNCHRNHASMVALPSLLPHAAGLRLQKEVEVLTGLLKNAKRPFIAIVGGAKIETKIPIILNLSKVADFVLVGGLLPLEIAKQDLKFDQNVVVGSLEQSDKDLTEESANHFVEILKGAKTVVWNGPMGRFEEGFEGGTMLVANAIIESGAHSVIGGGETTAFLISRGLSDKFSFVSTGGGAMLEFLSGKELPGIAALS